MASEASESGPPASSPRTEPASQYTGDAPSRSAADRTRERALAAQKKIAAEYGHILEDLRPTATYEESDSLFVREDSPAPDQHVANFGKAKAAYERKKRAQTATMTDEVEYVKLEAAEQARLRKLKADREYDQQALENDAASEASRDADAPEFPTVSSDDEATPARAKRGPKRKKQDDGDLEPPTPKKKRVPNVKKPKSTARVHDKSKKERKTKDGPTMTNLGSVFGTNVFDDAVKMAGVADQPQIAAGTNMKRRDQALRGLMASVPEESRATATSDKKWLEKAIQGFTGQASVKAAPDGWLVKGMRSTLKHYQIMGTSWMRQRESDPTQPRGGIQADEMGLGKTARAIIADDVSPLQVMMLANIVNGRALGPGRKLKTATLIVASPALVAQWFNEINKHCFMSTENKQHGLKTILKQLPGTRITGHGAAEVLEQADIVLTTYHEVMRSYPKAEFPPELVTAKQKEDYWNEYYKAHRGILHSTEFHRIVLDEAQVIKNHRSHTSMACRALTAKIRWALTGTPIMNNIKEFYPYFKFLRIPHTGSYKIFKENFCLSDDPNAVDKLHVFLRRAMIRRTHGEMLLGARLLDLPKPSEHIQWVEFNDVERTIYEIVKKRFIERINKISKEDGLERQYSHIWTMILRLRQITAHPLLVQRTIFDLLCREDFERLNKLTESENEYSNEGASLLIHLRTVLKNNPGVSKFQGAKATVFSENETVPIDLINVDEDTTETGGKHGTSYRFRKYLNTFKESERWEEITERTPCSGCRQPPSEPHVTSCFHIYCEACLHDIEHHAARRGFDQARCAECGEVFSGAQPCDTSETATQESRASSNLEDGHSSAKSAQKQKKKTEKKQNKIDWIGMPGEICPSAKTTGVKAQVLNWSADDPSAKIIIYTQFIPMIRILAKVCETEGWGYCKYTGEMTHESREKSIEDFSDKADKMILLASLKSGGLGLNLTMASRVIIIDPWWNEAIEQQAFCRVYRIGQAKTTKLCKLVVKNTVDAAMTKMKERKSKEINTVMEKGREFTVLELMQMFGHKVGEDDQGKPFIFAEPDNDNEYSRVPHDSDDEHFDNDP